MNLTYSQYAVLLTTQPQVRFESTLMGMIGPGDPHELRTHVDEALRLYREEKAIIRDRLRSQREEIGKVAKDMRRVRTDGFAWSVEMESWLAALDAILRQE